MKRITDLVVSVPTLAVALLSLVRDESLFAFAKKVGGTWLFLSVLVAVLRLMWRMSRPPVPKATGKRKAAPAGDSEPEMEPASEAGLSASEKENEQADVVSA